MRPPHDGIICLGASAGGLSSLQAILAGIPADLPWPVLITQHLQPGRVSDMPAILARSANMPVRHAGDGETPRAGTIYTCPSSNQMGLTLDGRITLSPLPPEGPPRSIDHLFATASYAHPARTVAVVLSGTGNDGAVGSLVVKLNEGTVLVEDEAAQSAMPAAAQRAGTVDAALPANGIAPVLHDLASGTLEKATAATHALVDAIAKEITHEEGPDLLHYRPGTLRRQAEKRRAILGIPTLREYRDHLRKDPPERERLTRALFVPVTQFFRDPAAWQEIEKHVIPQLAQRALEAPIRVWCVGCATGEEAYSIAMLLSENIEDKTRIQILGTDVDALTIKAAAHGSYDPSRLEAVDDLRRERFFVADGSSYRAADDLRRLVHFRVHDATRAPTPGEFDLILCRNLLIYFDTTLQSRLVRDLRGALVGPRFLFLGSSETLPADSEGFLTLSRAARIYQAPAAPEVVSHPSSAWMGPHAGGMIWSASADVRIEEPDALVFLLDETLRIQSASPRARTIMDAALEGNALLDLFPRWHGSPVEDALRTCVATGRSLKVRAVPTPDGLMDVTIEPAPGAERGLLLIATPAIPPARHPATAHSPKDLHATNDELQSANEELAATNEELQATNEELATLNEEFQATNQALAATNNEMGANAKLTQSNVALFVEILLSRPGAMVACDAEGRIGFYNRSAAALLKLDASVIGRPAHALDLGVAPTDLEAAATAGQRALTRAGHRLHLTIERVGQEKTLGWILAWTTAELTPTAQPPTGGAAPESAPHDVRP